MSHSRHLDGKCAPLHDLSVWIISTSGMELATMLETLSCGFNPTSQPHIDATTMERSLATTNACARSRGRPSPRPRPKHLWHRLDACTEGELSARTASRMPAARPQPRFQRFRRPLRQARLRRQVCRHELAMAHSKRLMTYVKSPRERESCRRTPVPCGASPCDRKSVKMMILARVDDRLSVHPRACLSMILNAHDEGFQALSLDWSADLGQETSDATWP